MMEKYPKTSLTKEQKTGFVLLLIFGILAVGLGVLQLRNTIYSPFVTRTAVNANNVQNLLDQETRLQMIDTDQDGLNDFEELTFYETSPYLPDTDSDGLPDKIEIEQGTNPLCPEGSACDLEESLPTPTTTTGIISPLVEETMTPLDILSGTGEGASLLNVQEMANDPQKLRELLIATGQISEEALAGVDDKTLLDLVQEIMGGEEIGNN